MSKKMPKQKECSLAICIPVKADSSVANHTEKNPWGISVGEKRGIKKLQHHSNLSSVLHAPQTSYKYTCNAVWTITLTCSKKLWRSRFVFDLTLNPYKGPFRVMPSSCGAPPCLWSRGEAGLGREPRRSSRRRCPVHGAGTDGRRLHQGSRRVQLGDHDTGAGLWPRASRSGGALAQSPHWNPAGGRSHGHQSRPTRPGSADDASRSNTADHRGSATGTSEDPRGAPVAEAVRSTQESGDVGLWAVPAALALDLPNGQEAVASKELLAAFMVAQPKGPSTQRQVIWGQLLWRRHLRGLLSQPGHVLERQQARHNDLPSHQLHPKAPSCQRVPAFLQHAVAGFTAAAA